MCSYRTSGGGGGTPGFLWGPMTFTPHTAPETEEEVVEHFQERITWSQEQQLFPLQEDLADWINKTLGVDYLSGENFMDVLDNGAVLCRLALVIQERAQCAAAGAIKEAVPRLSGRCWDTAARRSFFSRDNTENFIQFCRKLGVHENLLFESDDLVLHNRPRHVVLCLLEVARLAARFDVEPPALVQLEKEIAAEERCQASPALSRSPLLSWQFHAAPSPEARLTRSSSSSAVWDRHGRRVRGSEAGGSDGVHSDTTEDEWSAPGSGDDADDDLGQGDAELTDLDRKVHLVSRTALRQCRCAAGKCAKLRVKKVGDGKYSIAGRNVFIRVLKGRHMMVRVGGGWDTLEHFLLRHDPCQTRPVARDTPTPRWGSAPVKGRRS